MGSNRRPPTGEAGGVSAVVAACRSALLPFVALALVIGTVASISGADDLGVAVWLVASGVLAVDLVLVTIARLREGRVAVDVVALAALVASMVMGEPLAGVILALIVASGDALEQHAHRRAARSSSELLSLAPKVAHRLVAGAFETVAVDEVMPGEVLLVKPGEVVPVDGTALESAVLDESVLTGGAQSVQREGRRVGAQRVAERRRGVPDVRVGVGVRELVCGDREAGAVRGVGRAPFVRLADRYAVMFVPAVFLIAGGTSLLTGESTRMLAVLVVATPCPLVLAAPVAIVSGIACAARDGVVVKDGAALEAMGQTRTVLLGRTGTLTAGRAHVVAVVTAAGTPGGLRGSAGSGRRMSSGPACQGDDDGPVDSDVDRDAGDAVPQHDVGG